MDSMKRMNVTLEERLTNEMVSKRITENVELIELRRTMVDCETELHELRQQYIALRTRAENELDEEQRKLSGYFEVKVPVLLGFTNIFSGELSNIVKHEMAKNKLLNDELMALKNATNMIQQIQTEASEHQARVDIITTKMNRNLITVEFCRRKVGSNCPQLRKNCHPIRRTSRN